MSSPAKQKASADNNTVTNGGGSGINVAAAAAAAMMTPAQQQIWQQQQQQMWQQQQIWQQQQQQMWQQQQFAIAEAQKSLEGSRRHGHRHNSRGHHHRGMELYRAHAMAQHSEGQAWAAAKANGGHPGLISASETGQDSTTTGTCTTKSSGGVVKTTQYIKRGEEGNDGTGLRGTSKTTCQDGMGPRYVYRDFSHLPQDVTGDGHIAMHDLTSTMAAGGSSSPRKTIGEIRHAKLPVKLEHILSEPSFASIVGWMPHGRAWKVFKTQEFTERVLPLYFESSNYSSFIRIVNAWGFRRLSSGPDENAYYHELFLRGRPHLLSQMKRLPKKARKAPISKDDEPDFYALESRINKEGPVSITGAGFVKGSTFTSVGPTAAGLGNGTSSDSHGNDNGNGPAALSPQQQEQPPPSLPGMTSPWMNPWISHNPWMFPQQAPMVMGALMDMGAQQGQVLPMTMYAPTAAGNVGATGLGNTAGASAKESQEETEDEPTP